MATPVIVQSATNGGTSVPSVSVTLTGVAAGNAIIVGISDHSTSVRGFTVSDDQGNTYQVAVDQTSSGRNSFIFYAYNVAGGDTQVTVTIQAGLTESFRIFVEEVSGLGTTDPLDQIGTNDETTNTTTHACSAGLTTASDVYVMCVGTLNASGGTNTAGTGYTRIGASFAQNFAQSRVSATALTGETGAWTSSTARFGPHCMASFKAPAGGGGTVTGTADTTGTRSEATASGSVAIRGSVAATSVRPTADATGSEAMRGTVAASVALAEADAGGKAVMAGSVTATAILPESSAAGAAVFVGSVDAASSLAVVAATATAAIRGTVAAVGTRSQAKATQSTDVTGTATAVAPLARASATAVVRIAVSVAATSPRSQSAVTAREVMSGTVSAAGARSQASVSGGLRVSGTVVSAGWLPLVSSVGVLVIRGGAAVEAPMATVDASGDIDTGGVGVLTDAAVRTVVRLAPARTVVRLAGARTVNRLTSSRTVRRV